MVDRWSAPEIFKILSHPVRATKSGLLSIKLLDDDRKLAIGFTAEGLAVFVAPQRTTMTGFKTADVELLVDQTLDLAGFLDSKLFVLKVDTSEDDVALAIASVLAGFVQMYDTGKFEEAVFALKTFLRQTPEARDALAQVQIGLVGELAFILRHPDPGSAVRAWHHDATGTYDFGFAATRFEVKTTLRPIRKHWLKYTQFGPSQHRDLYLASVYTGIVEDGLTAREISNAISKLLTPNDRAEFQHKISGYPIEDFILLFDLETAITEMRFFDAASIPVPSIDDDSILDMRWQVAFDSRTPLSSFPKVS